MQVKSCARSTFLTGKRRRPAAVQLHFLEYPCARRFRVRSLREAVLAGDGMLVLHHSGLTRARDNVRPVWVAKRAARMVSKVLVAKEPLKMA
jgi:hypothetical protein